MPCVLALLILAPSVTALAQESLTLGVHPYLPATELVQRFTPLANYLSEHLGRPVTLQIAKDYQDHIDEVGMDGLDIAFLGPAPYVKMTQAYGKKPILARLEIEGRPFFRGVIVTRDDSRLRSLRDLKGKRFAFGDPESTMSHLVPTYVIWKAGVDPQTLAGFEYLYSHHNVALGVLMGAFDAGAVKEEVLASYEKRGLRALAVTPLIPEHLFVARGTLPESMVQSLRQSLYKLNEDPKGHTILSAIKATVTGMVPASDADYDDLRRILEILRKAGVQF